MNTHPFLQKLLNGQMVEWRTVEEIFHLKNGHTPSKVNKEYWENGTNASNLRHARQVLAHYFQKPINNPPDNDVKQIVGLD